MDEKKIYIRDKELSEVNFLQVRNLGKTEDVLHYAGISRSTLNTLMRQGLPRIKIGRTLRFDMVSVEEWFKKREVKL